MPTLPTATISKTLDYADLRDPGVRPTVASLNRWVWRWLLSGERLGVNGHVKRRTYIRAHKMWEYSRGLALTGASAPVRGDRGPFDVLDVGGAMTAPVFYLASLGDRVVCLDIDASLVAQTADAARRRRLSVDARTTDLAAEGAVSAASLGVPGGFDRIYCFCVIEHILPPGQERAAAAMGRLLKPGGELCVTFDFGEHAPTEAPLNTLEHVQRIREAVNLPLKAHDAFLDTQERFALDRKYPDRPYTFGSLFFHRPRAESAPR